MVSLINKLRNSSGMSRALSDVINGRSRAVQGLYGMSAPLFCAALADELREPLLTILPDNDAAALFERELQWILDNEGLAPLFTLHQFPDYDIPDLESPSAVADTRRKRLATLDAIYQEEKKTLPWALGTLRGAARKTLPAPSFRDLTMYLSEGAPARMQDMVDMLLRIGYQRARTVESAGHFCVRGGMIDVFPAQSYFPVRVEMAGDKIDDMRLFDVATQRSKNRVSEMRICPCSEASMDMVSGSAEILRKDHRALMERGVYFDGAILYPDVFGATANPLLDGFFPNVIIVDEERCLAEGTRHDDEALKWMEWNDFDDPPALFESLYADIGENSKTTTIHIIPRDCSDEEIPRVPVETLPPLPMKLAGISEKLRAESAKGEVVVISKYKSRLDHFLAEERLEKVQTCEGDLRGGVCVTDVPLYLFTDSDMFHRAPDTRRKVQTRSKDRLPIQAPEDISPGDFIVHVDHGVGIYEGMTRQSTQGYERDFFKVKYGRGDVLFVPIDQMNRIEKYIGAEAGLPKIYPLHSTRWAGVKQKVRKKVEDLAAKLYSLYQEREHALGHSFTGENVFLSELEESFPFVETEDQERSIKEVFEDMERPCPMDRLVYGDVGFGKTEVAIRAAFKATMDRKQVAILAPTTILAHQHGETFRERLGRFPVKVEVLSRFRSAAEQKETLKRLAAGEVDIIIGTHRLLSKDVKFRDLGLLVIDEEQRFGVKHKEQLKMLKTNVDTLTLTATPIPRTLNMSMIGLRDMSLISTPPDERRAVKTYVEPYNTRSLYLAVERELARDGQVYYVHNNIETILTPKAFIEESFPNARVAVSHGKMHEKQIEKTMVDFYNGEYDVLVSTTIIENGLDIPNVNTLIVVGSENFGLGQMYQLRGRVGRSYRQSYAYFFHAPLDTISEKSRARLDAIRELAELGSGYRLAMKDLEIRGAGNLLGKEQHGYVREVGFHLFCQMLEESVRKFKGESEERPMPPVEVDFAVDAFLPENYIEGVTRRTYFYKRIVGAADESDLELIRSELKDMYGALPQQAKRFILTSAVRLIAGSLGIISVKSKPKQNCTDLAFHEPEDMKRFQNGPYPIGLTLDVEHMADGTRIMHGNAQPDRIMTEIRDYLKFVYDNT